MKKEKSSTKGAKANPKSKSIELLNKAVADELSAVHQYMYFHFHCDDQNLDLLSVMFKRTAIQEMLHVEKLADRILFLKGEVEMIPSQSVSKIHDVKKMLEMATAMEAGSVHDYNVWANECGQNADSATKKLFEALVDEEEIHGDQFQNEIDNIEQYGVQYLVLQSMERSKSIATAAVATGNPTA